MKRQKSGRQKRTAVILSLVLACWAYGARAEQIGYWEGYFPYLGSIYYFDHPLVVPQDGLVTLITTADSTFFDQNSATQVRDGSDYMMDYSPIMGSPNEWSIPLAAGSYTVRIGRGLTDKYGNYTITAHFTPANPGATEIENNDTLANANTNPDNLFAGAIGHIRSKNERDWNDYYCFILTEDTDVHFDLTFAATLVDINNTILTLRNGSDYGLWPLHIAATSMTWDFHLAAGTYYLRLYTAKYGGYTIATTTIPAAASSSETEPNDSIGTANPILSKKLYGSVGYMRTDGNYDTFDYFSCQVAQGGTLSIEILSPATLHNFNNGISIRNAGNVALNYDYLDGSPRTVTVNNLEAGTYYIRVSRAVGYGAYQINVSGNVILHNPRAVGAINMLLLP